MTLCILLKELVRWSISCEMSEIKSKTQVPYITIFGASTRTCSNDWKTLNPNFMTKNWPSVKSGLSENVEWMVGWRMARLNRRW